MAQMSSARLPGSFRIASQRRSLDYLLDPATRSRHRIRRIIDSISADLDQGATARVRRIPSGTREMYRLELALPEMAYERITILDREALTALLEQADLDALRDRFQVR